MRGAGPRPPELLPGLEAAQRVRGGRGRGSVSIPMPGVAVEKMGARKKASVKSRGAACLHLTLGEVTGISEESHA